MQNCASEESSRLCKLQMTFAKVFPSVLIVPLCFIIKRFHLFSCRDGILPLKTLVTEKTYRILLQPRNQDLAQMVDIFNQKQQKTVSFYFLFENTSY